MDSTNRNWMPLILVGIGIIILLVLFSSCKKSERFARSELSGNSLKMEPSTDYQYDIQNYPHLWANPESKYQPLNRSVDLYQDNRNFYDGNTVMYTSGVNTDKLGMGIYSNNTSPTRQKLVSLGQLQEVRQLMNRPYPAPQDLVYNYFEPHSHDL